MLIAVPWPVPLEQSVIQSLMHVVAATSVDALHWCGYPAVQQGNLIDLGRARLVGVEEACSGVRSVQTMLMTALFLGEIWYRRFWKRVMLIVVGLAVAFAFNVGRAFTLAWLTASRGTAALNEWHERVGHGFLGLMLASFALLAFLWRDRNGQDMRASPASETDALSLFSWRWSAGVLAWLVLVWAGTELWYRSGENLSGPKSEIVIHWPEKEAGFKEIPIPSRTGIILRHDEGRSAVWHGAEGAIWSMVYLRWKAGSAAVQLARAHTPDVCLPAAGGHIEEDRGVIIVPVGDLTLPAHAYIFTAPRQRIHVFYIRVGDDAGSARLPADIEELTIPNRIRAALARRRNRGQQVVEVAITSFRPAEEVTAAFKDFTREAFRIAEGGR
jgi:exosortase/archaeosortase family protein